MAKVIHVIVKIKGNRSLLKRLVFLGGASIVSFALGKGYIILGRYGTNTRTLRKILSKTLKEKGI